ncbi:hypothetical protein BBJ28_00006602 [Nothophytophthora sp. Chile5]|nr:hypothetical protein BBJ28_00006602 [Nothophytophthora sp. Chile5]
MNGTGKPTMCAIVLQKPRRPSSPPTLQSETGVVGGLLGRLLATELDDGNVIIIDDDDESQEESGEAGHETRSGEEEEEEGDVDVDVADAESDDNGNDGVRLCRMPSVWKWEREA